MTGAAEWWLAYFVLGGFVGFFAGLLGIGGGLVIVPVLVFLFDAQHFPREHVLHLALGTAMTTIVFTSLSSVRAHHYRQAVRWDVVRAMTPGILIGTLSGAAVAGALPRQPLAVVFTIFVYYAAAQMWLNLKPKPSRQLPGWGGLLAAGAGIGAISSLVAGGGAFLTIPVLTWCNVDMRQAVGTAAAAGLPIALAGAIGYTLVGLGKGPLPQYTLGFVYLPALIWLVLASIMTAPLGARAAHNIPVSALKRIFSVFMFLLATKMVVSLF
ncbi:sulfite exporter TauE/SafE family protein [Pelomicrobium methylotrophicum]|uniref:Probable membrane transporter protein n=1 Tax=Pelomicrobium methylotrophicum TaxID=2602750 RepID=A0A5C7EEP3_9PROT|nr:sulfite exporter TauE/SafE family protein [Pelomicrobium methylotrophicum]